MVALLDVSVLVPLFDADHTHHHLAHDWFHDHRASGWATCPLTENGLIRVLTSPAVFDPPHRPVDVIALLRAFREAGHHAFWPDSISLADTRVFETSMIRGTKQVADVYLLGLAKIMGGTLATFDRAIPLAAVKGATPKNLQIISAAD